MRAESAGEIRIRTAEDADAPRIAALFREMLEAVGSAPAAEEDACPDPCRHEAEDRVWVAEDGEVCAFLSAEVHREEPPYLYLNDFSVTEACRGRGIGTRLMREAEAYAAELGLQAVTLHVEKTNAAALRLYRRRGYTVFRDDGHRLLMVRETGRERPPRSADRRRAGFRGARAVSGG